MAVNISNAFHRTSAQPIDDSLVLTATQMLNQDDNVMPDKYFAISKTDGCLYLYDKSATANQTTGKYTKFEGGGSVTSVKVGTTTYTPTSGVISLPEYIRSTSSVPQTVYAQANTPFFIGNNSSTDIYLGYYKYTGDFVGGIGMKNVGNDVFKPHFYDGTDKYELALKSDIPTTLDSVSDGTTRKLSNYLPLSGGTVTGSLTVNEQIYNNNINASDGNGMLAYKPSDWSYVSNTQWGLGATNCQGVIRSNATNLIHSKNGTSYSIVDTSNSAVGGGVGTHISKQNVKTGDYILITINSYTSWMLSFRVRLYANYVCDEYIISGYNYGSSYWYSPTVMLANTDGTARNVKFGYTSQNHLWVAIPNNNYYGCDIIDVVNGYTQVSSDGLFTLTETSTLSGTTQTTVSASPFAKSSETGYKLDVSSSRDELYLRNKSNTIISTLREVLPPAKWDFQQMDAFSITLLKLSGYTNGVNVSYTLILGNNKVVTTRAEWTAGHSPNTTYGIPITMTYKQDYIGIPITYSGASASTKVGNCAASNRTFGLANFASLGTQGNRIAVGGSGTGWYLIIGYGTILS